MGQDCAEMLDSQINLMYSKIQSLALLLLTQSPGAGMRGQGDREAGQGMRGQGDGDGGTGQGKAIERRTELWRAGQLRAMER